LPRFSQRLEWNPPRNALTEAIERKRSGHAPLLDLTISNPTEAFRDYPHQLIREAFCRVADFRYVPEALGNAQAREAVAAYYRAWQFSLQPERIALTASTSEAYALLFKLLCNPGDEVLVPTPSYPLFDYLASAESVRPVAYRLRYDGSWFIDFESLAEAVSPRSRAIVLVNPNNPTGSFLKASEWEPLAAFALRHQIPIISDEVFLPFELSSRETRLRTLSGQDTVLSFSLGGLSKAAGMPQLKLAWILVGGPPAESRAAMEALELLLDSYLSVNSPVQSALPELLSVGGDFAGRIRARVEANFAVLQQAISGTALHSLHLEGGWSVILQFPQTAAEDEWILRALEEQDVVLHPGYFFDMPAGAYGVASLITEPDVFREAVSRLLKLLA
jgi:alanine-synthesizing transaminase